MAITRRATAVATGKGKADAKSKQLVAALRRLETLSRLECLDPIDPSSRPTAAQLEVIDDFGKVRKQFVRAGNQCLAAGTLVRTGRGDIEIEKVQVGDTVYGPHGNPIRVVAIHFNGLRMVADLLDTDTREILATCTARHRFALSPNSRGEIPGYSQASRMFDSKVSLRVWNFESSIEVPTKCRWGFNARVEFTYDITVDSKDNLYCLANGLVTHNSGKTSICVRNLTWALTGTHPKWTTPADWRDEPLLAIVCGRTGKQIEESLLPRIIRLLEPGSYREIRIGNMIQRLELVNGSRIVFQSLENPGIARERLQSYTAHIAWVDELPPTLDIIFELFRSVQARDGIFMASFTPLVVNVEIQKYIDAVRMPLGKVYRFQMLDNPIYRDPVRQAELLESFRHLPEDVRRCRLYGDWMSVEDAAYQFDYDRMVMAPEGYSPSWRHVESSDPATESALGMTIWAEDPNSGIWYCIREELVSRIYVPTEIVEEVKKLTSGINVVRRVSDPAATWYMHQAAAMGLKYVGVHGKNSRNVELIKQLQEFLGTRIRIAPWCSKLIGEIQEARWSDRMTGKIVADSKFHLTASARYFCDNIPRFEKREQFSSWDDWLYRKNEQRKEAERKAAAAEERKKGPRAGGTRIRVQRGRRSGGGIGRSWI